MQTTESTLDRKSREATQLVAGFRLPGTEEGPVTVDPDGWEPALQRIREQRLTGLATAAWEEEWLLLTDDHAEQLLDEQQQAMVHSIALERELLDLGAAFNEAEIDFLVLKGPGVAHCMYPDPSWRVFVDLDLLVRTRDWQRATALLAQLGLRRTLPEPRRGFDERFGKAAVHETPRYGLEVDLHRTLVVGPFGLWIEPDALFDRTTTFQLGGRRFQRLEDTALLLHACLHAALGLNPPLLSPIRDVGQIAWVGEVEWEAFKEMTERWHLGAVVRHAFQLVDKTLNAQMPRAVGPFLRAHPSKRERRALEAYVTDRRGRGGTAVATLKAIRGIRAKSAYVRALVLPQRAFLRERQSQSRLPLLSRWWTSAGWLRRRRQS